MKSYISIPYGKYGKCKTVDRGMENCFNGFHRNGNNLYCSSFPYVPIVGKEVAIVSIPVL